jgi:S1-C subfamily serine protease
MTGLDWIVLGIVILLALFGWAQGFVAGALALVGFAIGAWVGTRVGPLVLPDGADSGWAPAFGLMGALVAGAVLAMGFEGLGARLRARVRTPAAAAIDGALGALLTACVGLGIVWVLGAVALGSGGELRQAVQRSSVLQRLNTILPPTGGLLNALENLDPFPRIDGPEARVRAPSAGIVDDAQVDAAARSVVKVLGTACGLGVEGSGWIARDGIVVTNAHVVAGQDDTTVQLGGEGASVDADAVWFDPDNDLAILRAPGVAGAPALSMNVSAEPGASAAVLGFPEDGPYDVQPARLGQTSTVISQDAYGRGPLRRTITSVRGLVRQGNSGGPVVDGRGKVVATVFAQRPASDDGYAVPNEQVQGAVRAVGDPLETSCVER